MATKNLAISALIGTYAALVAIPANALDYFGTRCQKSYQNGWQATLDEAYNRCGWFNNQMDNTAHLWMYYDLVNARDSFHENGDNALLEMVDLAYINTHGGVSSANGRLTMWNDGQSALSSSMRYGDDAWNLSVFSMYACKTMATDNIVGRWEPAMHGGLKMLTGSHDIVWDGVTTNEVGEDYAAALQGNYSVKQSWHDGNTDWWEDQDLAVMASGVNSADCAWRRDNMIFHDIHYIYSTLRDSSIGYWCWSTWTNA